MRKNLLVLAFFLAVLFSKNFFGLKLVSVIEANEATQAANLDQTPATESADLDKDLTPTPNFCENGSDPDNDEGDDDCIDREDDDDDDDDGGDDGNDDDDDNGGDGGDGDDNNASTGGGGGGGVTHFAPAGGFADMVATIALASGLALTTLGVTYGKKKKSKKS